jgi:tripartite-type tricarboxylate transporter receptor subunit TctC
MSFNIMKSLLLRFAMAVSLGLAAAGAVAQGYPARPIEVVVCYGAGGGTDLTIRLLEGAVSKLLGQKIVVTNRPGAGGALAMNQFVRSAPDGYLLALAGTATLTVVPHAEAAAVQYKPDDYAPVAQLSSVSNFLIVPADSPFKSLKDLIDFAKKNPPGRVKAGITSTGSMLHLPFVQLEKLYDVKFTFIPHKSSAPVVTAIMGGHLDVAAADMAAAAAQVRAGSVRALGVFAAQRLAGLPNVPTLKEQGADIESGFYNVLLAPKGTPEPVIATVREAFRKVLSDPEVIERGAKADIPLEFLDSRTMRERIDRNYATYGALLKELGLAR